MPCMNDKNMDVMILKNRIGSRGRLFPISVSVLFSNPSKTKQNKTHTDMDHTSNSPPSRPVQVTDPTELALPAAAPTLPGI